MQSFLFALNAVAPIILMVAVGYFLKRLGFMNEDFVKKGNKLGFRLFLPVMLFMNVYKIEDVSSVDMGYIVYAMAALAVIFAISIPLVMVGTTRRDCRGVLLQSVVRSNYALIGIPLAGS
jgi:predicted permease